MMWSVTLITTLLHLTLATPSQKPLLVSQNEHGANIASAKQNANQIFNAIHSSMRQWGSSINHNGMSFFPASIPEGTLLYHGHPNASRPPGLEWIAFELPHAENFARQWKGGVFHGEWVPGYLQIYQAKESLDVLYVDGMSAGNSLRGTLDSQDILLLNFTKGMWAEYERAGELCKLADRVGIDAFVRMECGFELLMCDFTKKLDFISNRKRPEFKIPEALNKGNIFEFTRDIASRYNGIGAGRVLLDYSSMISAFFYPADLSNPDPDPRQAKLPRLVNTDVHMLEQIRNDLQNVVTGYRPLEPVNWQGVTDMIVTRFANRLQYMASDLLHERFLSEVNQLMNTFIDFDFPEIDQYPVELCSSHYLQAVKPSTPQDHLIAAAFKTVTYRICKTIYDVRASLLENQKDIRDKGPSTISYEVRKIKDLMAWLDWSVWTSCGQCAVDEVCFIAFFPIGTAEDHYNPRCQNSSSMEKLRAGENYWIPEGEHIPTGPYGNQSYPARAAMLLEL